MVTHTNWDDQCNILHGNEYGAKKLGLYFGVGLAKSCGSTPSPNDSLHFKLSGIDQILAIVLEESFFTWRRRQWVILSFKLCLCHLFMPIDVVGFPSKIIHLLWMEDLPQT